jgi:hypothetical protein
MQCKVGVMDDWRYVRRDEAVVLAKSDAGFGAKMAAVLADPSTLYRFPFPWEDGKGRPEDIDKRDMFATVEFMLPPGMAQVLRGIEHQEIWMSIRQGKGSYVFNVAIPCPLSESFGLKHSAGGPVNLVSIYGERYDIQKRPRTIFRCGYCEAPFSVNQTEIEAMRPTVPQGCGERIKARPAE